jgi:hypothetical protein
MIFATAVLFIEMRRKKTACKKELAWNLTSHLPFLWKALAKTSLGKPNSHNDVLKKIN